MTTQITIKKEIEKIRRIILPPHELWTLSPWPFNHNQPHGKYGYQKLEMHSHKYEAIPEDEEMALLRKEFESIELEVRQRTTYWDTWEHFLEYRRCKCDIHRMGSGLKP